ncbi:MAG: DUF2628 domain-containing protein [Proteobacteria bacterium]|nr:DUF2628 domain-containing protein [Pseudomonadota bacterium]
MKLYNVLVKKNPAGKIQDIVLLKDGFSWLAFFFSGLWFLYHRMWKEFLVLIVVNTAFVVLAKISSGLDRALLEAAFLFLVALNANYWRCEHLKKNGYELVGLVFGANKIDAKLHFVEDLEDEFCETILDPKTA